MKQLTCLVTLMSANITLVAFSLTFNCIRKLLVELTIILPPAMKKKTGKLNFELTFRKRIVRLSLSQHFVEEISFQAISKRSIIFSTRKYEFFKT